MPPGLRLLVFLSVIVTCSLIGLSMTWWFLWQTRQQEAANTAVIHASQRSCDAAVVGMHTIQTLLTSPAVASATFTRADILQLETWVKQINDELYTEHQQNAQTEREVKQILQTLQEVNLNMIRRVK